LLTIRSIVFVHGLRGHPRGTWEATASESHSNSDTTKKPKGFRSLFKRRVVRSPATDTEQAHAPSSTPASSSPSSSTIFWPEEYLALDVPQARVWTYGYNADVIQSLFQANNKNSISQHGQDLSVRLEREIGFGVGWCQPILTQSRLSNSVAETDCVCGT
jgi:hypothetical protein